MRTDGENRSTRRQPAPVLLLSTTNPKFPNLGLNPGRLVNKIPAFYGIQIFIILFTWTFPLAHALIQINPFQILLSISNPLVYYSPTCAKYLAAILLAVCRSNVGALISRNPRGLHGL
jgi:hypothetical protein